MSNIEVHQCSRFCLGWFLFALSLLLFIIIDRNCPLSKVLCRIIIQVGHQKYFLGPLYVTLFNWLWHLWHWLWLFSHIKIGLRSPLRLRAYVWCVIISLLWWIQIWITLLTVIRIKQMLEPLFTKVIWSLSVISAWDSDRWLTSNFLHTTLQRRSNTDESYTDEGNLIPDES